MYNGAQIRIRNNSQQVEDVTEVGSNQSNNAQVPGNARKIVRGPTFMPKVCTKTEEDCISVLFNEYGQPVDKETTGTLALFIGSLARSGKFCKLHKQWYRVKSAKKRILLDTIHLSPVWGCDRLVIRAKVIENQIMAASAIIISSDSSDESVGSPPSRVILFGDIPTVIPSTSVVAPETSTIAPVISSRG
ncbi:hypothetical protein Tco_0596342 [Tanacetum coccineum]